MAWIKVTPETMPPIKEGKYYSNPLWMTLLDKRTGERKTVKSFYMMGYVGKDFETLQNEFTLFGYIKRIGFFVPEYEMVKKHEWSIFSVPVKRKNIKVTHWAMIEESDMPYPKPAED